ncbi:hypothetical protein EJ05DRAFT_166398 [Pseudovirgaria hyperparasitica]|uniref:Uncharacterized protein n=1 Tax=Pseudovirgaria hyperparasitica TaxID=470096 RepID=A0A6A6VWJ6_9PEZI|nr:uncharacterized protein EJ05DRAFT_166398 [Pseudovirgaria hyperparasitica]KAF2753627.1 hypothetical protein EJ05DRAFT_166398 [Pseudovirgaria hyperparasitica]
MNFVSNIIQSSVAGFVDSGMRTAGGYAGDILNKAGDYIESGGAAYGRGSRPRKTIATGASSTTKRPVAVKRAHSTPVAPNGKGAAAANMPYTGTVPTKRSIASSAKPRVTDTKGSVVRSRSASATTAGSKYTPGVVTGTGGTAQKKITGAGVKKTTEDGSGAKYTPGVVTGMPKGTGSSVKRGNAGGSTKKTTTSESGKAKYTPGVVTGMPASKGVKE